MTDICRSIAKVLDKGEASYEGDVYSFGIVVWEVLTRQAPWANEGLEWIVRRVMIKQERPEIPPDLPDDMADLARACWATDPAVRPLFSVIMQSVEHDYSREARDLH